MFEVDEEEVASARPPVVKFSGIASQPAETSTIDYPQSWAGVRGWMRVEQIPVKGR